MDYHIKEISEDLKTVSVVFHIPVALGTNTVGTNWRTALIESKGGADKIDSDVIGIVADDITKMKAGEIYERSQTVRFSSLNLTDAERLSEIEAAYTKAKIELIEKLQLRLKYYGKSGIVSKEI